MWLGSCVAVAVAVMQASSCAPIRPLAWELPYATHVALKEKKKEEKRKKDMEGQFTIGFSNKEITDNNDKGSFCGVMG